MLNFLDGRERTLEEFANLGQATGWKLEGVKPGPLAAVMFSAAYNCVCVELKRHLHCIYIEAVSFFV